MLHMPRADVGRRRDLPATARMQPRVPRRLHRRVAGEESHLPILPGAGPDSAGEVFSSSTIKHGREYLGTIPKSSLASYRR
jgi:hypothetical protein